MIINKILPILLIVVAIVLIVYDKTTNLDYDEYEQKIRACSNLSEEVDRDYCRIHITEQYRGE